MPGRTSPSYVLDMVPSDPLGLPAYIALLGDVDGSKQSTDRETLRRDFRAGLDRVRRDLGVEPEVESPLPAGDPTASAPVLLGERPRGFVVTAGDEFTSIFRVQPGVGTAVRHALVTMSEALYPAGLTFGLGWGPLTTDATAPARELDGPCYHRARSALGEAKRRRVWARLEGFPEPSETASNGLLHLLGAVRGRWTARQMEFVVRARFEAQKDVAAFFDVNPAVVSESLSAASWRAVREAEGALEVILEGTAAVAGEEPQ